MKNLWAEYHSLTEQIARLEAKRAEIAKQLETMTTKTPSIRDVQVCLARLHGRKVSDIAAEHGITHQAVSKIVKKVMPVVQRNFARGVGGI